MNPYKNEAVFRESSRVYAFLFFVSLLATILFSVQKYASLLNYPSTIGEPLFWIDFYSQYLLFICMGIGIVFLAFKYIKVGGGLVLIALVGFIFSFKAFYHPLEGILWFISYWGIPELELIHRTLLWWAGGYFILFQSSCLFVIKIKPLKATGAFGTADFDFADNLSDEVTSWFNKKRPAGFIVGRHFKTGALLKYSGDKHLTTNAPTRSGKGVGLIIPNLLSYPHNVVVIDPKGENCNITWKYRREVLNQDIIVIDPFYVTAYAQQHGSNCFNPFDIISPTDPEAIDFCKELAATIVQDNQQKGGESHWVKSARRLVTGLFYYVCKHPEFQGEEAIKDRTIAKAYGLLNQSKEAFEIFIENVIEDPSIGEDVKAFAYSISKKESKELSGVISTAEENLGLFMDSYYLRESITCSDFILDDVITKPTTLYIVLPQNRLSAYSSWLRLTITTILNRGMQIIKTIDAADSSKRMLWLLDEFGNLGKVNAVKEGFTLLSGYGFTFWIFLQNLSQLKENYPKDWDTFIDNSGILQAFNAKSYDTTKYLSDLAGKTSILTESESENLQTGKIGVGYKSGQGKSISERERNLLNPDEIRRMKEDDQLIYQDGKNVSLAKKIAFFKDPYFKGKYMSRQEIKEHYEDSNPINEERRRVINQAEEEELRKKEKLRKIYMLESEENPSDTTENEEPIITDENITQEKPLSNNNIENEDFDTGEYDLF